MAQPPKQRKKGVKHVSLTLEQKHDLIQYRDLNPQLNFRQLADYAADKFGKRPSKSVLSNLFKHKKAAVTEAAKHNRERKLTRQRKALYPELEDALARWIHDTEIRQGRLDDQSIISRAKLLAQRSDSDAWKSYVETPAKFSFSQNWLLRFKKDRGIHCVALHGEAASADQNGVALAQTALPSILKYFDHDHIYNMDETGLQYRQLPGRSLSAAHHRTGTKQPSGRVTVALCCNASGTHKLKPFVIGNAKKPRCFHPADPFVASHVHWNHNKCAWMNSELFELFLKKFWAATRDLHGEIPICLLMDNAPAHKIPIGCQRLELFGLRGFTYNNIHVIFLPPNTSSVIQPLDQGIIRALKARFRKCQSDYVLSQLDQHPDLLATQCKIDVRQALTWLCGAWDDISKQTINHCWGHCRIGTPTDECLAAAEAMAMLSESLKSWQTDNKQIDYVPHAATDLVDSSEPTHAEQTIEEEADEYLHKHTRATTPSSSDSEVEVVRPPTISAKVAHEYAVALLQFVEDHPSHFSEIQYKSVRHIVLECTSLRVRHQTTLDSFVHQQPAETTEVAEAEVAEVVALELSESIDDEDFDADLSFETSELLP